MVCLLRDLHPKKEWAESVEALYRPETPAHMGQQKVSFMVISVRLDLKEIFLSPRDYPWPRPERCSCGSRNVWGHGFVLAIFEGFPHPLEMRRYRCPVCGCVTRLRPETHFSRIQSQVEDIREVLTHRLETGRWPPECIRNRARHWLRALKRKAFVLLGLPWLKHLMTAFDRLIVQGWVPVSRSI